MIGLFQENGPCHFEDNATEPTLNPYSWNEYANMLYVDQPFGVGFSNEFELLSEVRGTSLEVNSTVIAATNVWKLLQAFYAQFPQYKNRDFGLFTESYGGHYGPEFASYFESQNSLIAQGSVTGQNISLVALAINNGWYDSLIQEKAYIDFSLNNTYAPLINASTYTDLMSSYNTVCFPAASNCSGLVGDNEDCRVADDECQSVIDQPLYELFGNDFNVYDIRPDAPQPPENYVDYLNRKDVLKAIGAKSSYEECSNSASGDFYMTGDRMSLLPFPHPSLP
jgi:carboxypeptidase C (cathepsin A)